MFQPAGEHVHPALFRAHADLLGGEVGHFVGRIGHHSGRHARVSEIDAAALGRLQADIVDTTEVAIGMEVHLVEGTGRAEVYPGLMPEFEVLIEFQGFADLVAHLQDTQIDVVELGQVLQNVWALPAFDIGVDDASRVTLAQAVNPLQQHGIEGFAVIEKGGPEHAGEERLRNDLQDDFLVVDCTWRQPGR